MQGKDPTHGTIALTLKPVSFSGQQSGPEDVEMEREKVFTTGVVVREG